MSPYAIERLSARRLLQCSRDRRSHGAGPSSYVSPIAIGAVYIGLGEKQNAMIWLERAYEEHDGGPVLLRSFALWAPFRGGAGYESLLRRLEL